MNYRHAYHAGNFADVVKHVALTRLVEYLKRKDKLERFEVVRRVHAPSQRCPSLSAKCWYSGISKDCQGTRPPMP